MAIDFNSQGYLYQTIALSYEEFVTHFGINARRKRQIENAKLYFNAFYQCGCQTVYVDGSFVSTKFNPEDIDLCFDLTNVDMVKIKQVFPQFFDINEIGRIHRNRQCHLFYFTEKYTLLFDMLQKDRNGNSKGLVKLSLNEFISYDQKYKSI